jgi:hypothetical protein
MVLWKWLPDGNRAAFSAYDRGEPCCAAESNGTWLLAGFSDDSLLFFADTQLVVGPGTFLDERGVRAMRMAFDPNGAVRQMDGDTAAGHPVA